MKKKISKAQKYSIAMNGSWINWYLFPDGNFRHGPKSIYQPSIFNSKMEANVVISQWSKSPYYDYIIVPALIKSGAKKIHLT